ncbi:DUF4359 domain-containing protein [Nitrospiraceae bacterium AH_259_D15_M11_P09]|nr:DUF4359 domain-containing protein [Nitrospiraceae bacterium AH_259_D15_M11_P09]
MKKEKKSGWALGVIGIGVAVLGSVLAYLATTNPALADYRTVVLEPAAQERSNASDAMLVSILQSIPMGADSVDDDQGQTGTLSLLMSRTQRNNYLFFSVYSTEYDYCEGQTMKRESTKMLGIAGKFHTLEEGGCPTSEQATG